MMGDTTSFGSMLFDLNEDPTQNTQIHDEAVEMRMKRLHKRIHGEKTMHQKSCIRDWGYKK